MQAEAMKHCTQAQLICLASLHAFNCTYVLNRREVNSPKYIDMNGKGTTNFYTILILRVQ